MTTFSLNSLTEALQNTRVSPSGVSFAGQSLKLDNESDAKQIVDAIEKCSNLQYLNLEGNTLGVDASKEIAKALEKHPEFVRALWKDMFTGRMKTEIPKALQYLGNSLVTAGARLMELDLSDNAFGPIGVEGLASLLRSSTCYALEELRLNNNGLGVTGGKLLASALTDCYNFSKKGGKPLSLKVFIAGRNRLENDGAKALAQVFKMIGTLEEIAMPQNGIYHVGIAALSEALTCNKNLHILNLNDNTITAKGAEAIAKALPHLQQLRVINFGDCLLKTKGTELLADALKDGHLQLEEVTLGFNEIRKSGAIVLVEAMANKINLKSLQLDGNMFGEEGKAELKKKLQEIGKLNVLGSLEDNESEESDENDDVEDNQEDSEESEEDEEQEESDRTNQTNNTTVEFVADDLKIINAKQFILAPSADNFMALGSDRVKRISEEIKHNGNINIEEYVGVLMKVSALSNNTRKEVAELASKCSEALYTELFAWAQEKDQTWLVNNYILINLGLIKDENKRTKPSWNLEGCLNVLKNVIQKNCIPNSTKNTLKVFMQRELEKTTESTTVKEILACVS